MNRQIIKKLILCLMTVILCVTTCAPAFASKGDRTLMHFSDEEQANDCYINSAFRMGDGFCIYYREGSMNPKQIILRYADAKAEPEKFILQDDMSAGEGDIVSVETEPATETDLPAAEIGMKVGYSDPHYFYYSFKKSQGMTPKEFRQAQNQSGR